MTDHWRELHHARKTMVKLLGAPNKCCCFKFLKIVIVQTIQLTKVLEIIQIIQTKPIREVIYFWHVLKPYFGFKMICRCFVDVNAAFSGQVLKIICNKQINWVIPNFHESNLNVYSHTAWNIWQKCTCVICVCQIPPSNRRFYDFGMEFIDRITTDPATIYIYTHILLVSASHLSSDRHLYLRTSA